MFVTAMAFRLAASAPSLGASVEEQPRRASVPGLNLMLAAQFATESFLDFAIRHACVPGNWRAKRPRHTCGISPLALLDQSFLGEFDNASAAC